MSVETELHIDTLIRKTAGGNFARNGGCISLEAGEWNKAIANPQFKTRLAVRDVSAIDTILAALAHIGDVTAEVYIFYAAEEKGVFLAFQGAYDADYAEEEEAA